MCVMHYTHIFIPSYAFWYLLFPLVLFLPLDRCVRACVHVLMVFSSSTLLSSFRLTLHPL